MSFLRKQKRSLLKLLDREGLFLLKESGYLKEHGWFRSHKARVPQDLSGEPIPWITYPAIAFLSDRVHSGMTVFEYGCGNSTLWWAKRVEKVFSCEHDRDWYGRMKAMVPANTELYYVELVPGGEYSRKAAAFGKVFDVIVIDGRDRVNCAINSVGALKDSGVIIWDNTNRDKYKEGFDFLAGRGYRRLDFEGAAPGVVKTSKTTIFYKAGNCLNI